MASQKIVNLALVLAGAAVFLFLSNLFRTLWILVGLPRMTEWIIAPPQLVSFAMVAGGVIYARRHEIANGFLNEVAVELSKVTWPDKRETVLSTGITCVLVIICALILFGFDGLWGTIMSGLFAL